MPVARVTIRLKPTVLDAQGAVIRDALHRLGFAGVADVHMGKYIELDVDEGVGEEQIRKMCQDLLANPIIEEYSVTLGAGGDGA